MNLELRVRNSLVTAMPGAATVVAAAAPEATPREQAGERARKHVALLVQRGMRASTCRSSSADGRSC